MLWDSHGTEASHSLLMSPTVSQWHFPFTTPFCTRPHRWVRERKRARWEPPAVSHSTGSDRERWQRPPLVHPQPRLQHREEMSGASGLGHQHFCLGYGSTCTGGNSSACVFKDSVNNYSGDGFLKPTNGIFIKRPFSQK